MPGQAPAHLGLRLPQTDKEQQPSKPGQSCFHQARKSRIQGNPAPRTGSDTTGSAGQPTARHTPLVIDPPQQPDGTQPVNNQLGAGKQAKIQTEILRLQAMFDSQPAAFESPRRTLNQVKK
ncbi:hypothetical protein M422DRAFT_52094 [Sphaerobolus stellatus SS14]|uniref:Uncharacterized protein n=1 Tax=Sphaerobolus stellatus (strain SS14) TaxID=990650 RepID=A0A0C9UY11_SPHS4|nr:hypothetical protein M422DRAFT_52094 [Sphaerobolus stellatus SS14]